MGDLLLLNGEAKGPAPRNETAANAMRRIADIIESSDREIASFGYVLAYHDGTIGLEYGGGMLTTLLGGAVALTNRIEREL